MLSFPLLGRIWCTICPFMAVVTWAQEIVTGIGGLQKWSKWVNTGGGSFAVGLFFLIFDLGRTLEFTTKRSLIGLAVVVDYAGSGL